MSGIGQFPTPFWAGRSLDLVSEVYVSSLGCREEIIRVAQKLAQVKQIFFLAATLAADGKGSLSLPEF